MPDRPGSMIRLPDGRKLGCLQIGKVDGFPIFHFHGNGSSRFEVLLLADLAQAAGARLVGCGLISTICPPELVRQAAPGWMRTVWRIGARHPDLLQVCLRALLPGSTSD